MRALLLALLLALAAPGSTAAREKLPRPAPAFKVVDLDGKRLRLEDFKGQVLLVDFWATWCGPCLTEIPKWIALQERYRERGLRVLGLSMDDDLAPVRKYRPKAGFNYPVALATPALSKSFGGVLGLPVVFLIDRNGKLVERYDGPVDHAKLEKKLLALLGS